MTRKHSSMIWEKYLEGKQMFYSVKLTVLLLGSKQLEMDKIFYNTIFLNIF